MMNKRQILEYLNILFNLEKRIYEQDSILSCLANEINKCNHIKYTALEAEPNVPKKRGYFGVLKDIVTFIIDNFLGFGATLLLYLVIIFFSWMISFYILGEVLLPDDPDNALKISIIIAILSPILLIAVIIAPALTIINSIKYSLEKKNYCEQLERISKNNIRISANNEYISQANKNKMNKLIEEYDNIKKNLDKTSNLLQQYYNVNIIYRKYRRLPYIASFIEYFESGRCDSFEGHEGAYNILENDIKYDNIIDRMDIIIERLDNISSNQYVLYSGLRECNKNIRQVLNQIINSTNSLEKQINSEFNAMDNKLSSIEYANYITANNTQYLSMLETYKIMM